jgi:hypothetical protein
MLGERAPTLLHPCSLFPSLYHHIDKPYGITIFLPPYSNMLVVLTYLKSTYVFDYLQHLSTTLFLVSMFHLHHNLQHIFSSCVCYKYFLVGQGLSSCIFFIFVYI